MARFPRTPTKTEPPSSFVRHNLDGSTTYVGALATKLFQAMSLRACLASPVGTFSTTRLLTVAQAFTGHHYAPQERLRAIHELDDWIAGMELVVPVLEETS